MTKRGIRVTITVTVEIDDPDQWTTAFGVVGTKNIKDDVRHYVGDGISGYGVFGDGEVDAHVDWR